MIIVLVYCHCISIYLYHNMELACPDTNCSTSDLGIYFLYDLGSRSQRKAICPMALQRYNKRTHHATHAPWVTTAVACLATRPSSACNKRLASLENRSRDKPAQAHTAMCYATIRRKQSLRQNVRRKQTFGLNSKPSTL